MTLDDFVHQSTAVGAGLVRVEVLALRLYTGKGYWLINTSCRAATPDFAVTAFTANRAIGKLAESRRADTPAVLYRGMRGKLQPWFTNMYRRGDSEFSAVTIGRLADGALMSTTANMEVATGPYSGDVVFVISKDPVELDEWSEDEQGFQFRSTPAPVQWVSQFPAEEEYLWPTHTSLIPKKPSRRHGVHVDGKIVYEFTPVYLWDTRLGCIGRWQNIPEDDMTTARTALKLASKGFGFQFAYLAVPALLLEREMDEDLELEDGLQLAFSVFDSQAVGWAPLEHVLATVKFFFSEAMGLSERKVLGLVAPMNEELSAIASDDPVHGKVVTWEAYRAHFSAMDLKRF